MKKLSGILFILIILLGLGPGSASAQELFFEPSEVSAIGPGDTVELELFVDKLPDGLSGYILTLGVDDPGIATISEIEVPSWVNPSSISETPAASVEIKAAELDRNVEPGASNVSLATVKLKALDYGTTELTVSAGRFENDFEKLMNPETREAALTVDYPTLALSPENIDISCGKEQTFKIIADRFPTGLAGYNLTVEIDKPETAEITAVEFPAWTNPTEKSSLPGSSIYLKAVDGPVDGDEIGRVRAGDTDVVLASFTVSTQAPGESKLALKINRLEDDNKGTPINARTAPAALSVIESDWTQFQKDSFHSAYTYEAAPVKDPELFWKSLTSSKQEPCGSGGINAPALISGNRVFVTAGNASVWAFNKSTGRLLWKHEFGGTAVQTSTPALGEGRVFIASSEGDLHALDIETGKVLWSEHVTDRNFECPLTYADHKLYIGEGLADGVKTKYYYCYDDEGNKVWEYANKDVSGFIWSGAAVVGDYLVYPVFEGKMVCLNKDTGEFIDEVDFSKSSDVSFALADPGMFRCSVTYADGALYTSSERGQETGYCFKVGFDPATGHFLDKGWASMIGFSTSTPVVYEGRVYVGHGEHGETGAMFCLNDSDGSVIWKTPISGGIKSSPVLSVRDGKPYIYFTEAIDDGSIYCLRPDGTLAWHYNPPSDGSYTLQGAAISGGKVYYGTDNGCLYCIGEGEPLPPIADFTADHISGDAPLTVRFKDTSFNANEFLWNFGDGSSSGEVNPVHTYKKPGTYTVMLTVRNEHGENSKKVENYIQANAVTQTWTVHSGESIQAAINKADSWDTIKVYAGEYHESLTVDKTLIITGIKDPILSSTGLGLDAVTINAGDVEFRGFKLEGTDSGCFAININANGALIEKNEIDRCAKGVKLAGTGNTLRKNRISNCRESAAVIDNTGGNRIYQNTFVNNNGLETGSSNKHISGGKGDVFHTPGPVKYFYGSRALTGYMGNYYDDYSGSDQNPRDGIGDSAYSAGEVNDAYPLMFSHSEYEKEWTHEEIPENSWFQFHGTIDHLGYSETGPETGRIEWIREDIEAVPSSSPVIAQGKLFVNCKGTEMGAAQTGESQLVALDEFTGEVIWKASAPKSAGGSWASPAYDNGMVFTATGPELGCYAAETGEKLWCFNDTKGDVCNSGPAIADGMVIFTDWDGHYYYCLDEYTGDLLWSFEVAGNGQSVPAYADGKFFLTSYGYGALDQGHAYCVDARTGKQLWYVTVKNNLCGSPAYKDGVLYLTTYPFYGTGDLLAMDAADGSIIWQKGIERTDATPALAHGNVYVCGGCKGFSNVQTYCFNATTGELVWETPALKTEDGGIGGWTCSVAVADGLAYVGSEGKGYFGYNNLYALDAFTGDVVWNSSHAGSAPALADGMLFSVGGDQKVYAFGDPLPVADFRASPRSGKSPLEVQFTDLSENANNWKWDLNGNGEIDSTKQDPVYTYDLAGNYTITLTAGNSRGTDVETKTKYIVISETSTPVLPKANFNANVTSGAFPLTVEFMDRSTGEGINSWAWDFNGDGEIDSDEQNPEWKYENPGTYNVSLKVSNEFGESTETKRDYIQVTSLPSAAFKANVTSGSAPLTVRFTDLSENTKEWFWDFGDGTNSTEKNPTHTYTEAGTYDVSLKASNEYASNEIKKLAYINVVPTFIKAPTGQLSKGESKTFSIELARLDSVDGVNFKLEFNDSLLDVDNVEFSEDFEGTLDWKPEGGVLSVSAEPDSQINIGKYTEFIDITFNVTGDVPFPSATVPLKFAEAKVVKGSAEVNIDNIANGALELIPAATIGAGDAKLEVGENATFTVSVEGLQAESVKFFMNFNQSLVSVESITTNTSEFEDLNIVSRTINNKNGWFRVFLKSPTGISAENTAPLLDIKIKSKGVPGKSDLTFGIASWKNGPNFRFDSKNPGEVIVIAKTIVATETGEATIKNATFKDDEQKVSIGTDTKNVKVSEDNKTIEIRNPGLNINLVSTDASGFEQNASAGERVMEGNFSAQIEKPPVEAPVGGEIGTIKPFFDANATGSLSNLTNEGAALNVTVTPGIPEEKAGQLFSIAGLNIEEVAYTMSIKKKNLEGVDFKDAKITMPVPQSYVDVRGGPEDFKILSINDTGFVTNLSTTYTRDDDSDPRLYIFTADSPNGFSDKVLVKATDVTKPEADFDYTPKIIGEGDSVNFMDNSSNAPTSWEWDFGDGSATSTEQTPVHSFEAAGTYPVTLNASNAAGWNSVTKTITVGTEPEANFSANRTSGELPLAVKLEALSENATEWFWDFGDGTNSNKQEPEHVYTSPGVYNVSLKAGNAYGEDTFTIPAYIHVTGVAAPVASFTATPKSGYAPLTVQFNDTSTGATEWLWDFGDGTNSTEKNPEHIYNTAKTYTVSLNVSNDYGRDVFSDTITVTVKPSGGSHGGHSSGDTGGGMVSGEPNENVKQNKIKQAYVSAGSTTRMVTDEIDDVMYVAFVSKTNAGKVVIRVETLNDRHSLASKDPEGEVYRHLNIAISKGVGEKIESGTVGFKVSKQWLEDNNIDPESIVLQHYVDKEWVECPTKKMDEDSENYCFEAEVSSFSPFAITGPNKSMEIDPATAEKPGKEPTTEKEQTKPSEATGEEEKNGKMNIPGFKAPFTILGILLVFRAGKRNRKEWKK